jgi:3,4-dihydroxy 2-butanone 4-phosphate synthase/GTP cyclohydrolase II
MTSFDPIERAIDDIAAGRPVVVADDEDRENEGDLVFAAEPRLRRSWRSRTSAADRAHTIRTLAEPTTVATDLARPGHVLPLRAR